MSLQVGKVPYILLWIVGGERERERDTDTNTHKYQERLREAAQQYFFFQEEKSSLGLSSSFSIRNNQVDTCRYGGSFLLDWLISPRPSFSLLLPTWS